MARVERSEGSGADGEDSAVEEEAGGLLDEGGDSSVGAGEGWLDSITGGDVCSVVGGGSTDGAAGGD